MSKMWSHDPFGYLKHKLWPKIGQGIKLSVWLSITKSQESPWFPYAQVVCHIPLKSSWQGLQLFFKTYLNQRSPHKVMGSQSWDSLWESQLWEFWDSHLGVPRHNNICVLVLWPSTKYTIRGKVVASPKSGPWWVLWIHVCP